MRRGDQVYVEYEDSWTGKTEGEWRHSPVQMCSCGRVPLDECELVHETTFTETYRCGHVHRYANRHGYDDNVISKNRKK